MKKNLIWLGVILVLALVSAALWHSYKTDPLASLKETKVEVLNNHDQLKEFMDTALAAIQDNDQRTLFKLFGGDPMAFKRRYMKGLFKENDFCPAEVKEYRKLIRATNDFFQAEVFSVQRKKTYLFNIYVASDGSYMIDSVEEKH